MDGVRGNQETIPAKPWLVQTPIYNVTSSNKKGKPWSLNILSSEGGLLGLPEIMLSDASKISIDVVFL